MSLEDQLKKLFPYHPIEKEENAQEETHDIWLQEEPLSCHFEKRKGKVNTIISGYNGAKEDFKQLSQLLKKELSVGGGIKDEKIIIQGDYRDRIMEILKDLGFQVKRVGG